MRNILLVVGIAGLVGLFSACGGDDRAAVPPDVTNGGSSRGGARPAAGSSNKSGSGGSTDEGGAGGQGGDSGQTSPEGPVVKIISPEESLTPSTGVLLDQVVHVVCAVSKSSAAAAADVDLTSIQLTLKDSTGKQVEQKAAASTKNTGEYAADFVVTTVESGKISFLCSAADKNKLNGEDSISNFIDHGPKITVIGPEPDSANPLKGGLAVDFQVTPVPLVDGDRGAEVDEVTFTLDGKLLKLKKVDDSYSASVALDDTNVFPAAPGGAIVITATNKRSPSPASAVEAYNILIDGAGPIIKIDSPADQDVVGGKVTLNITATDTEGSGVDPKSVYVTLYAGQKPIRFDPDQGWTHVGDKYTYTFDSKAVEKEAPVQATCNVSASDLVGNPSAAGQSVTLYLDNVAPQIDLDPLNVRMAGPPCSGSFDVVGDASLNDLQGTLGEEELSRRIGYFRVFVDERTNSQGGQTQFYYSRTNQKSVRLYIQPDPEHAATKLLINKNAAADNTCDDIGGIDNIENAPQFNALNPIVTVNTLGGVWNKHDPNAFPPAQCVQAQDNAQPQLLCPTHTSDMWFVPYNVELKEPYVYVVGTPNPQGVSCTGIDLAFLTASQPDGWVCVAARVVDNAGNVGISPPLRVCADDPSTPDEHPPCAISSVTPPSCTDGCTPPARGGGIFLK